MQRVQISFVREDVSECKYKKITCASEKVQCHVCGKAMRDASAEAQALAL